MSIKLWLDDMPERDPAGSDWIIARTVDECIEVLKRGNVDIVSLDHDLGDIRYEPYPREYTGMDVVKWMVNNSVFPRVINIHSWNRTGSVRMLEYLESAGANVSVNRYNLSLEKLLDQF